MTKATANRKKSVSRGTGVSSKTNLKSGEDFTTLSIRLLDDTYALCEETYAATKNPPPAPKLKELIRRAETHVGEYNALVEQCTGVARKQLGKPDPTLTGSSSLRAP
jgi:hypothetical protein